ncbi:MAG: hypothetical protein ACE5K7_07305, partial [Phycisphaerae bacterium]
ALGSHKGCGLYSLTKRAFKGYHAGEIPLSSFFVADLDGDGALEMLVGQNLPSAKALPVDETLADVRDALVRAGDAIAFQVKQHMVALGVPATTMDTTLAFARRGLLAALSLGNLDFMKADIAWVQGLLQHRGMDPTLLNAFWRAYHRAVLEHLGTTGRPLADWLEQTALESKEQEGRNT